MLQIVRIANLPNIEPVSKISAFWKYFPDK